MSRRYAHSGLETNVLDVFEKFKDLTSAGMNRAIKSALNKAAAQLQRDTKVNLAASIKHDTGQGYNDKLSDAVRRRAARGSYDEELTSIVHIMGSRATGSGTFRAIFLENGTKERYAKTYKGNKLKKPRYLGAIRPRRFFRTANQSLESQIEHIYVEELSNAIEKINRTKE